MVLSRTQEKLLRRYKQLAERPPTFLAFFRASLMHLLAIAALGAAGGYVLCAAGELLAASFFAGAACGAIARQLGQLRVAAVASPVLSQIIDQDRVQRLLDGRSDLAY